MNPSKKGVRLLLTLAGIVVLVSVLACLGARSIARTSAGEPTTAVSDIENLRAELQQVQDQVSALHDVLENFGRQADAYLEQLQQDMTQMGAKADTNFQTISVKLATIDETVLRITNRVERAEAAARGIGVESIRSNQAMMNMLDGTQEQIDGLWRIVKALAGEGVEE